MALMIIGVVCFIAGYFTYSSSKEPVEEKKQVMATTDTIPDTAATTQSSSPPSSDAVVKSEPNTNSKNELEKVIEMAIADGVLTSNERNIIKDIANTRGLDYNVIIKDIENRITTSGTAETEIIDVNKRSGDDFEKYVVQKFDKRFFKIKEWAGDKYVTGRYAQTTQHPDLLLEHSYKGKSSEFAVECKWRSNFYKGGIEFGTPEQFKRYQSFESKRDIPVFIVIGVKGTGGGPEELFIVPLKEINSNFIPLRSLNNYKKNTGKNFYFDAATKELK